MARLLSVLASLLLLGCGSSGVGPNLAEIFPAPRRSLEGSLTRIGTTDPLLPLRVGDDENDEGWRAFTSFELTVAPGRTLERALLRLHLGQVVGDPFGQLGVFLISRMDMGPSLDASDWSAPATAPPPGISSLPLGLSDHDVTPQVQDALNRGVTRVDLRLSFVMEAEPDQAPAYLHFTSYAVDSDPVSLPPTLVLTWR